MQFPRAAIRRAVSESRRIIRSGDATGARLLALLKPYHECTGIDGMPEGLQAEAIALLFSLVADGYRADRRPDAAASWYARASEIGHAHADRYAQMVIEHRLTDFYSDARATLQRLAGARTRPGLRKRWRAFRVWWELGESTPPFDRASCFYRLSLPEPAATAETSNPA
jgi:hypothetical protein